MTNVSMDLVKELREKTQISLMECKKALIETDGNVDQAIDLLRKRGAAVAAKRADNAATQGRIESFVASDEKSGALVQVSCETDFSANTDAMKQFAQKSAQQCAALKAMNVQDIAAQSLSGSTFKMQDDLDELIAKIAENIKISQSAYFEMAGPGIVHCYIHPGSHVGAMITLSCDKDVIDKAALRQAAKDICMQIAVTRPAAIMPEELDQALLEKEKTVAREALAQSNKPANVIEKIIEGKIKKYCEDVCLFYQPFIKNDKQTVGDYLAEVAKHVGAKLTITQYVRFSIGNK